MLNNKDLTQLINTISIHQSHISVQKIAVIMETYQGEKRVSLTPQAVILLIKQGIEVCIESNAGSKAGFSNADYIRAGATVAQDKALLYQGATIVTWVKPPADAEAELVKIPKGVIVIGFTNPFKANSVHQLAEQLGVNILSLELLPHQQAIDPKTDALAAMSRFAGQIALKEAIEFHSQLLAKQVRHINVLIIGSGQSGMAAARAVGTNNKLMVAATSKRNRREIEQSLQGMYIKLPREQSAVKAESLLSQQQKVLKEVICNEQPNIIITTARRSGLPAPKLLSKATLNLLPRNSVVIDLTASVGGNTEISIFDQKVCTTKGVWVCNKSNYPSAEPKQASNAYADCIAHVIKLTLSGQVKSLNFV